MELRRFLLACAVASCLTLLPSPAVAADFDADGEVPAGALWGLQQPGVTYEPGEGDGLAMVITGADGVPRVKLMRPGEVYVTAKMPDGTRWTYLLHITGSAVDETAVDEATFAGEVLRLVNIERERKGVKPLVLSEDLSRSAAIRAGELPHRFSHTRPDGGPYHTVLSRPGRTSGENIAAGATSPEAVVGEWMKSPPHRANILRRDFRELGAGHTYEEGSDYGHYWVQLFRG